MNEVTFADILFILLVSGLIAGILYLVKRDKSKPGAETEQGQDLSEDDSADSGC